MKYFKYIFVVIIIFFSINSSVSASCVPGTPGWPVCLNQMSLSTCQNSYNNAASCTPVQNSSAVSCGSPHNCVVSPFAKDAPGCYICGCSTTTIQGGKSKSGFTYDSVNQTCTIQYNGAPCSATYGNNSTATFCGGLGDYSGGPPPGSTTTDSAPGIYDISISPSNRSVLKGDTTTYTVTVTPLDASMVGRSIELSLDFYNDVCFNGATCSFVGGYTVGVWKNGYGTRNVPVMDFLFNSNADPVTATFQVVTSNTNLAYTTGIQINSDTNANAPGSTTGPSASATITISNVPAGSPPSIYIDNPANGATVSGTVGTYGWALDNTAGVESAISSVKVYLDGVFLANATYGGNRGDVCGVYPGRLGCPNVGWNYNWNTVGVTNGSHVLRFDATDSDSTPRTVSSSATVNISNVGSPMSGTLTPATNTCTIASGASTCNINFSWTTTNPVATSAVTSDTNNSGASSANFNVASGNNGTSVPFTIPYPNRNFYLYNNGTLLASAAGGSITATCAAGTSWNGGNCAPPAGITASCSVTPNPVTVGGNPNVNIFSTNAVYCVVYDESFNNVNPTYKTSGTVPLGVQNVTGSHFAYIRCYDGAWSANSGMQSCPYSVSNAAMSGTLNPATSSCNIASGASSCTINFTWTTTNPVLVSAVTSDVNNSGANSANFNVGSGNNGGPVPFTIPYLVNGIHTGRNFYLYNNGTLLAASSGNGASNIAVCAAGTAWNGSVCAPVGSPTATLTLTPVVGGGSTCPNELCTLGLTRTSASVDNPPNTVRIYKNGTLAWSGAANTTNDFAFYDWTLGAGIYQYCIRALRTDSSETGNLDCTSSYTVNASSNVNISANPTTIAQGDPTTLTWSSTGASSCTGTNFNTGGATSGGVVLTPLVTTTYTVTCNGLSNFVTVIVKKKPIFIEN